MIEFTAGKLKCQVLDVGCVVNNIPTIFCNAPEEEVRAALLRHHLDPEQIMFPMHPVVVETEIGRVLIDPGNAPNTPSRLVEVLQTADIDPVTIRTVILTHAHADHWGGCFKPGGALAFPQAEYVMGRIEWEFWADPDNPNRFHAGLFANYLLPLRDSFRLVEDGDMIVPGIQAVLTAGHTPGHLSLLIGGDVMHIGDVFFHVLDVEHPEWHAIFDARPAEVEAARRSLFRRLVDEQRRVMVYHFGEDCIGRVVEEGDHFTWEPE